MTPAVLEGPDGKRTIAGKSIGGGGGGASPFFSDGFESGDLSHTENGASWLGTPFSDSLGARTPSQTLPRTGSWSCLFRYNGGSAELRYNVGANRPEMWMEWYWFPPADWFHLSDGLNNNKFFALWGGTDYQGADIAYLIIEFSSDGVNNSGNANMRLLRAPSGSRPSVEPTAQKLFLGGAGPAVKGQWNRIRVHVDVGTGAGNNDGVWEIWVNDTKLYDLQSMDFYPSGGTHPYWTMGYFMGSFNQEGSDDSFYIDDVKMYASDPGW